MKIKMYFDGDTMEPAFGKPHVQRIEEVQNWMAMAAKVSDKEEWRNAELALDAARALIPIEVDDAD